MYIPEHFRVEEAEEIEAFIRANNFAQLVSTVAGRLYATHLPMLPAIVGNRMLGHLARQNPQHQELAGQEVLLVFAGPHDYVSPSWYGSAGVPTWNYQAVHVYGRCEVFTDAARLADLVAALTAHHEAGRDPAWQPQYPQSMLAAIVGVELTVTDIQCKYKLSQNRPVSDRERVADELEQAGAATLAAAMREQL